ncbi:MAG TPA: STAS domain-containing protein [Rudaea sp.]|jgi:anti-anti-sigma factor|nr:STAS domain-containing protein [Rudaea sp.]
MSLQVRIEPPVAARITVRPAGKLDATSTQEFDNALDLVLKQVPPGGTLVFDLADLEYISSAGLRSLFRARKAMKANGGRSLVMQAQPQVQAVLDIVKAVPVSEVFRNAAELDAHLAEIQRKVVEGNINS